MSPTRHTPLSRAILLMALIPVLAGLLLGNATLLLIAGALILVLIRARDTPPDAGRANLTLSTERAQRSNPIPARLTGSLTDGPFIGLLHQALPDTFLLVDGSNLHLVAPNQHAQHDLTLASPRRGAYTLPGPTLSIVHPLELAPSTTLHQGASHELTIEPTIRPLRTVKGLRGPGRNQAGQDYATHGPASTEFEELREYNRGDPLKHVNWKATAKHTTDELSLIVNEFEPEARKNIWFFLDLHESLEVGTTLQTALEDAIDITLALVHHFTSRGHRVGGTTFNTANPETFYPDTGSRQELIIARALAHAEPGETTENLPTAIERTKGFLARERPLVFLITRPETHTEALLDGIRRIHKHTATNRRPFPVHLLAPEPPTGQPSDVLARKLTQLEAQDLIHQGSGLLRIHRLTDGAKGLEQALAKGVMAP